MTLSRFTLNPSAVSDYVHQVESMNDTELSLELKRALEELGYDQLPPSVQSNDREGVIDFCIGHYAMIHALRPVKENE